MGPNLGRGAMTEGRDSKGRFQPGNKFWQMAPPPFGALANKPRFTAETLHAACMSYFDWCHDNPLMSDELVTFQGNASHEPVAKMRALTHIGLCMHIGISRTTWTDWSTARPDLKEVMDWAEDVVYRQKFEGAAAGLLNSSIIAREIGLADKRELMGPDGGPIKTEDVTNDADAFARRMARLAAGASGLGDGSADGSGQGGA